MLFGSALLTVGRFLGLVDPASVQTNYCTLPSCKEESSHTLCQYNSSKLAEGCGQTASTGLTEAEIQELLDSHNHYRKIVASGKEKRGHPGPEPSATNLGPMEWDDELASIAQRWANQCEFKHDQCRNVVRFQVGQNIAQNFSDAYKSLKMSDMVSAWYNEVSLFDKKYVDKMPRSNILQIGHYTQLVWAISTHLGCGVTRYDANEWKSILLVCNYGPAGNVPGHEIYKTP